MSNDNQSFFVKMRGRTLGPFDPLRLRQMVKQGQLNRVHMLSADGEHWQRASEFGELFQFDEEPDPVATATPAAASSSRVEPETAAKAESISDSPTAVWFYGQGDQSQGPVTLAKLRSIVSSGMLSAGDVVWREGMEDWMPVSTVPELAGYLQSSRINVSQSTASIDTSQSTEMNVTRTIIRSTNPWVFFNCIVMYVVSAALLVGFIVFLVVGARDQNRTLIQSSITCFIQMGVLLTASIFLNRYSSCMNRFINTDKIEHMNDGLQWLGRFWTLVGIVLIIYLVLFFVVFIVAVTTDFTIFGL